MDIRFPIGKLEVPAEVTLEDVSHWLHKIETFPNRLRLVVGALDDEDLAKTYREGSWTIRQLVHHIADSQATMYQRLKLALTDDNPKVPAFDEERWATLPDNELAVESSLNIIAGLNERIAFLGQHSAYI